MVPFKEGKFRKVLMTPFGLSKTSADLKDLIVPGRQQTFHADFGRRLEIAFACLHGVDVQFRGRRRDEGGCFHFKIALLDKVTPDGLYHPGPQLQRRLSIRHASYIAEGAIP
jgi:hypothetical protein